MTFSKRLCHWFAAILLFGLTILAHGSVNHDLQKRYKGKVLTLRQFYPGEHLHFDAAGKLANAGTPGAWTVDGQVRVKDISLKDGVVHIQGQRLFLFFDGETKQFRDVGSMTKTDRARTFFRAKVDEWAAEHRNIEIEVEYGVTQPEMADLTQAMNAVFLAPGEAMAGVVPDLWSCYFFKAKKLSPEQKTTCAWKGTDPLDRSVSAPRATYSPDPPYPELARQAGYQAVPVLWLIVDQDGLPQDVRVARPSGMGIDEAAASAVSKWRFDPAMKDGSRVAVAINVEVSFRLY